MSKEKANLDTTYCTNKRCKEKCWRHEDNYEFELNQNYWFQSLCVEKEKKVQDFLEIIEEE